MQHQHDGWRNRTRRLSREIYARPELACSLTIAVRDRQPVFGDRVLAAAAVDVLRDHADKTGVRVHGYCVMPDHVHLVLSPSVGCDIVTFVGQFKSLALRAARARGVRSSFWQESFWDHFARRDDDLRAAVAYVLANPVRRGLVEDWREYPFVGSLVFDDLKERRGAYPWS